MTSKCGPRRGRLSLTTSLFRDGTALPAHVLWFVEGHRPWGKRGRPPTVWCFNTSDGRRVSGEHLSRSKCDPAPGAYCNPLFWARTGSAARKVRQPDASPGPPRSTWGPPQALVPTGLDAAFAHEGDNRPQRSRVIPSAPDSKTKSSVRPHSMPREPPFQHSVVCRKPYPPYRRRATPSPRDKATSTFGIFGV